MSAKTPTPTVEPPVRTQGTRGGTAVPKGRTTMPAGKVLVVMLVCLSVWGLLAAPAMKKDSEAQPLGTRRTVSLWVLTPLAAIGNALQLSRLTDPVESALGKNPNAAPGGGAPPLPHVSVAPTPTQKPPKHTTKIRVPTTHDKLRIVVVGDSLAQGLGFYLDRVTSPALTVVSSQGRISSGLSRLDYVNWPAEMQHIMNVFHPDLVVVMIGENDNQSLTTPSGHLQTQIGTGAWPPGYQQRVQNFAHIALAGGAHVVWVGLPIVSNPKRWEVIQRQNGIFERVASGTPNMVYVDTWHRFATADGKYSPYLHDNGHVQLVRETDGVHFSPGGYLMIAHASMQAAVQSFKLTAKVLR
jgi:uncharacterized protein